MIPALATIIVIYVIYRCLTTTLIEGGKLANDKGSRLAIFILILLASALTAYLAITELQTIRYAGINIKEF